MGDGERGRKSLNPTTPHPHHPPKEPKSLPNPLQNVWGVSDQKMDHNVDLFSYYTLKLTRWKGNYPRIFSIGSHGLTTYNHDAEKTNFWQWTDIFSLSPSSTPDHPNAFLLVHRKGRGTDTLRFESEHRSEILTKCLKMVGAFAKGTFTDAAEKATSVFQGEKFCHGLLHPTPNYRLIVTPISMETIVGNGKKIHYFKDLDSVLENDGSFSLKRRFSERLHTFSTTSTTCLLAKLVENSVHYLGHPLSLIRTTNDLTITLGKRLGIYSDDQVLVSLSEFTLQNSERNRILLCLSEKCLIEREREGYAVTSIYPLIDVFALVRCKDDSQALSIEMCSGDIKTYFSTERDSLLASLMDGTRAAGNTAVHVRSVVTPQGKRWGPVSCPVDEKVESLFLKFLHQPPPTWTFHELLIRFNANIPYSGLQFSSSANGLFAENKEKLILVAINTLITKEVGVDEVEEFFQLMRRLVCSKTGFSAFSEMASFRERIGSLVVTALRSHGAGSEVTTVQALEVISALIQPMHPDSDLRVEQENKEKVLNSGKFLESLLDLWVGSMKRDGALVTMAMLDILTFALCAPYSETTLGAQFDSLLAAVASRAGVLFALFQHPSIAIVKGAGLLMKALIEEGQGAIGPQLQSQALSQGALIRHLLTALFVTRDDPRLLTLRQLSRHLIQLWTSQNEDAVELLKRIFPPGLLLMLESTETPPSDFEEKSRDNFVLASLLHKTPTPVQRRIRNVEKFVEKQVELALKHWRVNASVEARKNVAFKPVALRRRRQNTLLSGNWAMLYFAFTQDHAVPDLIWNFQTREELRETLQNEIRLLDNDREQIRGEICWNFADFHLTYKSLSEEIRVGGYYLRLLLEDKSTHLRTIRQPKDFFADLYHRFLLTGKQELRGMCLQGMTIVYERYSMEIGVFNDLKFIVLMLERSLDKTERDRLILFIQQLVKHPENARELCACGGLKSLVDLMTLSHLHTSRATTVGSNVLEASLDMKHGDSPEWFYMKGVEKVGPVGFGELLTLYKTSKIDAKTKVWANGLDSWRQLGQVPQTKWFIICESQSALMNESKLTTVVLDILIQILQFCPPKIGDAIIRPVHKAKQILSENSTFPHIVQVLLTFDPSIVERVAVVLLMLLEENPFISRVYTTGLYFFILMYTGSNILPITRFLHLTHLKQNTASSGPSPWQKSVLGPLLPEAMIAYLENHGVDKFSEIFLGDFDTPEAIWNSGMRRYLIERIALHLADFTPRLLSNTRALYDYCAIPSITYQNLTSELFCGVFYLRNLLRFPNWPISDPLSTLRDVLSAWKNEVEKKPPPMTVTEALKALEIEETEENWGQQVKKRYRKLAQMYHPDKNSKGRERFEAANKAYEFLCSRYSSESLSPDTNRIILILQTQAILFEQYGGVLSPYKYSGYPMLIKTIELDVADDTLFAKETPLLPHSTAVAFHTLNCSALNVEELRKEKGLELLLLAFDRCVSVLSKSSTMEDVPVLVCLAVIKCFSVATKFQLCRDKLVEMPLLTSLICQVFNFKHLTKLLQTASDTVASMAIDTILQMQLLQSGVLWHLLCSIFTYDYTLEESTIASSPSTNTQLLINNYAKSSITALKNLCGDEETTPKNDVIRTSLERLLLPHGAKMILTQPPEVVLKMLNSNNSTPYLIWNNETRSQLLEYCERQLVLLKSGDISDMTYGSDFSYEVHRGELVIGSIFIRIYITTRDTTFHLDNPPEFIQSLLDYLTGNDDPSGDAIEALTLTLMSHPGLEPLTKGKFRLFAKLLSRLPEQMLALLCVLFGNQLCVLDSLGSSLLSRIAILMITSAREKKTETVLSCLSCLSFLAAHSIVVKESVKKGLPIHLLALFTSPMIDEQVRAKAASVLARLMGDKISGPRVKILVHKLLPVVFTEAMAESTQGSVTLYDSTTAENPELVWNDGEREKLTNFLSTELESLLSSQSNGQDQDWNFNIDTAKGIVMGGENVVGGVVLRVYVANPNWNLRRPKEFLKDLLETSFQNPSLDHLVPSLSILLSTNPQLLDHLIPMGYVQKTLQNLTSNDPHLQRICAEILRFFGSSPAIVQLLTNFDSIPPIVKCLKSEHCVGTLCEALNGIFSRKNSDLVGMGVKSGLIQVLLTFLKGRDAVLEGNVQGVKANIVHALQSMASDEVWGEEVEGVLGKSDVWGGYKGQRHDLFLESGVGGYLQGGGGGGVYLRE